MYRDLCRRFNSSSRLFEAVLLSEIVAGLLFVGAAAVVNAGPVLKDCSKKKSTPGNACGTTTPACSLNSCSTWFQAAPGLFKLAGGLPTDNWLTDTTYVGCGNGGNCKLNDERTICTTLAGSQKFTYAIYDGGSCVVAP